MYGQGNVSQEAPPLPPLGMGTWQTPWGFEGLGARKQAGARQQKAAARQQARQMQVAGRTVVTTNPNAVAMLQRSLSSLQQGQQRLLQLAQRHKQTRSVADRNALVSFAKVHMKNLVDASGQVDPTARQIATSAATRAKAHNSALQRRQAARKNARLRGLGVDVAPLPPDQGGDPSADPYGYQSGGGVPPSTTPPCDPQTDPSCGGGYPSTVPPPYDPTAGGIPNVGTSTGGGMDMSMLLPLLLMGGGVGGGGANSVGCTNPNLPRCIIANMAAQERQQFMFVILIIMMMQQQSTQALQQSLSSTAAGTYGQYGYGPYGQPPYGQNQYGQPQPYGYPPYGQGYAPYSPYGPDTSTIPPGFDAGGGGGDMFAPGSGNVPSDINSIYPGPANASGGGGNVISSNQLPDGVATDTDGNPVGGDSSTGGGQPQPQIQSPMYAQSTSVSQGPMQVMMAPTPYMQPQLTYTDYEFATPNAVNYAYSQAMPPQMPGAGQPMQPILMAPLQSPPEMEAPERWSE